MNFLFDDSSTWNELNFLLQPLRDVRAFPFMAGIAIIYALTVSGEC